jgi:ferredoxin
LRRRRRDENTDCELGVARGPVLVDTQVEDVKMVMRVWIDRDLCTGDSLCEEICPDSFGMGDDGLAYVKEDEKHFGVTQVFGTNEDDPTGRGREARVADGQEDGVIEAAEECPGECIYIEVG